MKIRVSKNLTIDSRTLVRVEWRKHFPKLVVHEKLERHLKLILRALSLLGILSGLLVFDKWYFGLIPGSILFLLVQFFERSLIEFTTIIIQPPPNFKVEYNQWKTNGFVIPSVRDENILPHIGPTYKTEEYATNFFDYVRSWVNDDSFDDTENNIVLSIIIEPDEQYTTFLYANPERSRLDDQFDILGDDQHLEKHGKNQQRLVAQMCYWKTQDFKKGYFIKQFLEFYKNGDPLYLTPSVIQPFDLPPVFLTDLSIKKYSLKIKKRQEVGKREPEYPYKPQIEPKQVEGLKRIWSKAEEIRQLKDIQEALSKSVDLGFTPNNGKEVGVINLCFGDSELPFYAYKKMIELFNGKKVILDIIEAEENVGLSFKSEELIEPIILNGIAYNKNMLESFLDVDGGGKSVAFMVGFPTAGQRKVILNKGMSPLLVNWRYNHEE